MRFKQWLEEINKFDYEGDRVEKYFTIGHGEERTVIWALINGEMRVYVANSGEKESHGTIWGHQITDRGFKGRYEPDTGKLSVVIPSALYQNPYLDEKKLGLKVKAAIQTDIIPALEKRFRKRIEPKDVEIF
jgi:hypothetical protein